MDLPPEAASAPVLGKFRLAKELGQGGAGRVYRAWQSDLGRWVALKLLDVLDPDSRARFLREAQLAARLDHPNAVRVYEAGEIDGRPYIAMEHVVDGRTLDRARLSLRERVHALAAAARGVHAAHAIGIVHRDIKPSNILVTPDGRGLIADFGLARQVRDDRRLTHTGLVLGTPAYMPPEQAAGRWDSLTPRSDVYALGAVLHETLTGRPPYDGASALEVVLKVTDGPPPSPRRVNPEAPVDLETVAMRAMERDPTRRYESAAAFADDLELWLAGEPIRARRLSVIRRVLRRAGRAKAIVLPAAAAAAVVAAVAAWAAVSAHRQSRWIADTLATAESLERERKTGAARDAYAAVLVIDRTHEQARAGFERADAALRRRDEALRSLERARPALDKALAYLYSESTDYAELAAQIDAAQAVLERIVADVPDLALAHHLLGRAWEIKGLDEHAERCWRRAVDLEPAFGAARYRLGRLLLSRATHVTLVYSSREWRTKKDEAERLAAEAARELDCAMGRGSGLDDELERDLASAMMARIRMQPDEARACARAGIARYAGRPGVEEFHWLLGLHLRGSEQQAAYDEAIRLRPKFPSALYHRGVARYLAGDMRAAIADFERAVRFAPRLWQAHVDCGHARLQLGDFTGAVASYDAALAVQPDSPVAYTARGNARAQLLDLTAAVADHDRAIRLDPTYAPAYCNRGAARANAGDLAGALADFDASLRLDPSFALAWFDRGDVRYRAGDLDGAATDYERAIREDPQCAEAYAGRAMLRARRGDARGAFDDFATALRISPRCESACNRRAMVRLSRGEFREAVTDLDEALRLRPAYFEALVNRGNAKRGLRDFDGALADFDAALRMQPAHAVALCNRGAVKYDRGNRDGALADYEESIRADPTHPDAYANRASILMERGEYARAAADCEKALSLVPPDWPHRRLVASRLAEARRRMKD